MAKKSGLEHIAGAAHHAKALKDIIQAFMKGGWHAAALQALKHYWPQILAIALVLVFLPVIVFCCLPAMLFGFGGSKDTTISAINMQADTVSGYYDRYEEYCKARIEEIKTSVTGGGTESGGDDTVHRPEDRPKVNCETVITGKAMEKNWLISLHSVSTGNDLNAMSEQSVKDFVAKSIVYTVEDKPEETETESSASSDSSDDTAHDDTVHEVESRPSEGSSSGEESTAEKDDADTKILTIRYLTPLEFMAEYKYSDADWNWAQLMYRTLQEEETPVGGELGAPFTDSGWRSHITSEYGYRVDPEPGFHDGLDIGMTKGTDILAVKSGTVKKVQSGTTGYGNHIIIDHGGGLETLYAHCSELLVSAEQKVDAGTVIAKVGSTGNSTGPHLHIEIRLNGKTVDPLAYLS